MVTFSTNVQPVSANNQLNNWIYFFLIIIISTVQSCDPAELGTLAGFYLGLTSFHWVDAQGSLSIPSFGHSSFSWVGNITSESVVSLCRAVF